MCNKGKIQISQIIINSILVYVSENENCDAKLIILTTHETQYHSIAICFK